MQYNIIAKGDAFALDIQHELKSKLDGYVTMP